MVYPGPGLETCPSVGDVARSGDLATTRFGVARKPGSCSRPVPQRVMVRGSSDEAEWLAAKSV
jgi:hypothetical protein